MNLFNESKIWIIRKGNIFPTADVDVGTAMQIPTFSATVQL